MEQTADAAEAVRLECYSIRKLVAIWRDQAGPHRPVHDEQRAILALRGADRLEAVKTGFAWADVDDLRDLVREARRRRIESGGSPHGDEREACLESLADRIAALLPPREETP